MIRQLSIEVHAYCYLEARLCAIPEETLNLERQDRERILRGNAARLLGLA